MVDKTMLFLYNLCNELLELKTSRPKEATKMSVFLMLSSLFCVALYAFGVSLFYSSESAWFAVPTIGALTLMSGSVSGARSYFDQEIRKTIHKESITIYFIFYLGVPLLLWQRDWMTFASGMLSLILFPLVAFAFGWILPWVPLYLRDKGIG